ncbi:MAG: hypothetical protein RMJ98_05035 [Myxococcales bacterium]|nr:hypothetical protein [Polyangiaceae bacterium]MDW8248653.1 hypothetical protein [Myxococcales bacterium]
MTSEPKAEASDPLKAKRTGGIEEGKTKPGIGGDQGVLGIKEGKLQKIGMCADHPKAAT